MIDQGSVDRYMKFLGIATREGGELVMRGKVLETGTPGNYVTPTIYRVKDCSVEAARKSVFQQTEFFSPGVALLETRDPAADLYGHPGLPTAAGGRYCFVITVQEATRSVAVRAI